jgi:hypothetical protein
MITCLLDIGCEEPECGRSDQFEVAVVLENEGAPLQRMVLALDPNEWPEGWAYSRGKTHCPDHAKKSGPPGT